MLDVPALTKVMENVPEAIRKVEKFGTKLEETRVMLRAEKKEK